MKLSFSAMKDFFVNTQDVEHAATIENFLFDERDFSLRYIVVRCGSWLFGDKVLITLADSSTALLRPNSTTFTEGRITG